MNKNNNVLSNETNSEVMHATHQYYMSNEKRKRTKNLTNPSFGLETRTCIDDHKQQPQRPNYFH